MHLSHLDLVAASVAALARAALVPVWWSPQLFLGPWMRLTGLTRQSLAERSWRSICFVLGGSWVMAVVLALAIQGVGASTALQGAAVAALAWLGFVVISLLSSVVFDRKPFALFLINAGFQGVGLLVMGLLLGVRH